MKYIILLSALIFSLQTFGEDFCPPRDFSQAPECSGDVFHATSMTDLQAYLANFGDSGSGPSDLSIDFGLNGTIPEITSPCSVTLNQATNVAKLCVASKNNVEVASGVQLRAWEQIKLNSSNSDILLRTSTYIETGILNFEAGQNLMFENEATLKAWNTLELATTFGSVESQGNLTIESSTVRLNSDAQINLGIKSTIRAYSQFFLNSVLGVYFGDGTLIESQIVSMNTGSLAFGANSVVKGYGNIELSATNGNIAIASGQRLESSQVSLNASDLVSISAGAKFYAWSNLLSNSARFSLATSSYFESQSVTFNGTGISSVDETTINAWSKVTLDSPTCTMSSGAIINSPLKVGSCFDPSNPPDNLPPNALASATPSQGYSPLNVHLDASASNDSDGQIVSATWTLPSGEILIGMEVDVTLEGVGEQEIFLSIADDDGATAATSVLVTLLETPNTPPVAVASVTPDQGYSPLEIHLSANSSSDSDGTIDTYTWVLPNGQILTGAEVDAVIEGLGEQEITLTVSDDDGASHTTSVTVTLLEEPNLPPTAMASANPTQGESPLATHLSAVGSSDSDGQIISFTWTLPNGQTFSGAEVDVTLEGIGDQEISLVITDDDGDTASTTVIVTLIETPNLPPVAAASVTPEQGYSPLAIHLSANGSSDADGEIISFTWALPNGQTLSGAEVDTTISGEGEQSITLTVTDDRGDSASTQVVVMLQGDAIAPTLATNLDNGTIFNSNYPAIHFNFSDADSGVNPASFEILVDGQDVTHLATITAEEALVQFTSLYPLADGVYTLTAKIRDYSNNESNLSRSFQVHTGIATEAAIIGYVKDKAGNPLSGVSVGFNNGPVKSRKAFTQTDANGYFKLMIATGGRYVLSVEKGGFAPQAKIVEATDRVETSVGEMILLPTDPVVAQIDAATGGSFQNSLGSGVSIPAGVLPVSTELSFTDYVDSKAFPGSLPELSQFTFAYEFSKQLDLNGEISISLYSPILSELGNPLPIGTELVLGNFDPELGLWFDSGTNFVVQSAEGKLAATSPAGNVPVTMAGDANQPSVNEGAQYAGGGGNPGGPNKGGASGGGCPGCRINMQNGNLAVDHKLPSVLAFGKEFGIEFSYNSLSAFPVFDVIQDVMTNGSTTTDLSHIDLNVSIPSKSINKRLPQNYGNYNLFASVLGKNLEGEYLPTSVYPVDVNVTNYFTGAYAFAAYFGAPAGSRIIGPLNDAFKTREAVPFRSTIRNYVPFINERNSPFGAGWTLNEFPRLYLGTEGYHLITDGRGGAFQYFGIISESIEEGKKYSYKTIGNKNLSTEIKLKSENGALYVADCDNNQVFQIDQSGGSILIAGNGSRGFTGDNGPAINAGLDCPVSVTRSVKGDLFIADSGNLRIRKVDKKGIISTVAGNGEISIGDEGSIATEVGVGRPIDVMVDDLLVIYFTTSTGEVMMVDPRGKLRYFSGTSESYVPHDYAFLGNLQLSLDKRVLALDSGRRQILEIRPNNKSTFVALDLGEVQNKKQLQGIDLEIGELKQFVFDKKSNRYYVLDENGRLYTMSGANGSRDFEEVVALRNGIVTKSFAKEGEERFISSIAFSKEFGLVAVADDVLMIMGQEGDFLKGDKIDVTTTFSSEPTDSSTLVLLTNGQFERSYKNGDKEIFDSRGLLIAKTNPRNHNTYYRYDDGDRLTQIEIPGGQKFVFNYDVRGYLISLTDPAGRVSSFTVDGNGNLLRITNPDSTFREYAYDSEHLLTLERKENGFEEQFTYKAGKLDTQILPGGRTNQMHPAMGFTDFELDNIYTQNTNTLDAIFPSRSGNCDLNLTFGNYVEGYTDCLGRETSFINSEAAKRLQITSPEGRIISQNFSEKDLLIFRNNENGEIYYEYENEFKKTSKVKDALNNEINFTYSQNGKVESITDKRGAITTMSYNEYNLLTLLTDGLGYQQSFSYDENFNLASITDELGHSTLFVRDIAGNIISVTDADGVEAQYSYDAWGRPIQAIDSLGGSTNFSYTENGKISSMIDPMGNIFNFSYNIFDKLSSLKFPDGTSTLYSYYDNEKVSRITQGDGSEIHYGYDLFGQLIEVTTSDNVISYNYDNDGLMTVAEDVDSKIENTFDEKGRVKTESSNILPDSFWEYFYNQRGEITSKEFKILGNKFAKIDYEPNENGDIELIIADVNGQIVTWSRQYDARNLPIIDNFSNGLEVNYQHDGAQRLKFIETKLPLGSISSSFKYSYSSQGDITSIEERLGGYGTLEPSHKIYNFAYDESHRLIYSDLDAKPFEYDFVGNSTGIGFVVNNRNQLLETPEHIYNYDQKGNLVLEVNKATNKTISLVWSADNRLNQILIRNDGQPISGIINYQYDALGRRIGKVYQNNVDPKKSYSKKFVYDQEDLVFEIEDGVITTFYLHAPGIDNPVGMMKDLDNSGKFDSREVYFFTKDNLGSIREIVGNDGKIKQRNRYSSYGITTREKNDSEADLILDQPYGYTSRELDAEVGYYFYRERYYSPKMGRFLSEDPIGFDGKDFNLYRYVFNNPLRFNDPDGQMIMSCPTCVIAIIVIAGMIVKACNSDDGDGGSSGGSGDSGPSCETLTTTVEDSGCSNKSSPLCINLRKEKEKACE